MSTPQESSSRKNLLPFIVILLFGFVLFLGIRYLRSTEPPLSVAVMTWGGAGPGFIAAEKGFFDDMKVDFHIIDNTQARQAAYQNESFELYLTNPDQHPKESRNGLPGKMFMLSDFSNGADGVVVNNSIQHISELRGKRIAFTQGTASDFMLAKALSQAGLSREDVELVEVDDPTTGMAALSSKEVDAAVSWEPLMSQAEKSEPVHILFSSKDVPGAIIGVFIAKPEFLSDKHRMRVFYDGWQKGVEYYNTHRDEALEIMANSFKVDTAEMAGMMDGLILADDRANIEYFSLDPNGGTKIDSITNDAADYWHSIGLLPEGASASGFWTSKGVREFYSTDEQHE